jgi:glycosyltransferase involved in cell wall biosynthesis
MKILRIVITGEEPPHYTITKAFEKKFEKVDTFYWDEFVDLRYMNEVVQARVKAHKYDVVFMQLQKDGIITTDTAKILSENVPVVFNWTGDVRTDIEWFKLLGPHMVTLFTNMTDVEKMRNCGLRSDYLQTGYDHIYYFNQNKNRLNNIAYCASYYPDSDFPLTQDRAEAVRLLKTHFPEKFNLYGRDWQKIGLKSEGYANNTHEALLYNATSLALSISHFNYSRYFSDRLLREMACGCCVLSHRFQDCELEFEDKKHIVYWDDHQDLLEKVQYYLTHPTEARKIGDEASRYVSENYNWENVIENLKKLTEKWRYTAQN